MGLGSAISSETSAARLPPHSFASSRISFESTSSFFCASPWTFSEPAEPSPSASAPLLTRVLIALQARAMVSISRRRSALIRFLPRWRSIRNWVRLTRFMGSFYLLPRVPGAGEQAGGEQHEHRRHAERGRERAGGERDEG